MTAAFVFAVYAMAAPLRLRLAGGIALSFDGLLLGWAVSALAHLTAFTLIYLVLVVVGGLAGHRARSSGDASTGSTGFSGASRRRPSPSSCCASCWRPSRSEDRPHGSCRPRLALALASAWSGIAQHRIAAARIDPAKAGHARSARYRARRVAGADCVGRVAAGGCDRAGDCTCRHSPADRTPGDLRLGVHAAEAGHARALARGVRVHSCADRGTRLHARLPGLRRRALGRASPACLVLALFAAGADPVAAAAGPCPARGG